MQSSWAQIDSRIFRKETVNQDHSSSLASGQTWVTWETPIKALLEEVTEMGAHLACLQASFQLPQVLSDLPSLLITSSFFKYSVKFICFKPPGKHMLFPVSKKSTFCSSMCNTFHKSPVAQESANAFYEGLYHHNGLLAIQSTVGVSV